MDEFNNSLKTENHEVNIEHPFNKEVTMGELVHSITLLDRSDITKLGVLFLNNIIHDIHIGREIND